MSRDVLLRITVLHPPDGVAWAVQSRRSELIAPAELTEELLAFDLTVQLGPRQPDGRPSFRGPATQGPPAHRFVYVNSGNRAGQVDSCWDRRAKVPLAGITEDLVEAARQIPGARLEARIVGTAPDGGPACATVPLVGGGWRVIAPARRHQQVD